MARYRVTETCYVNDRLLKPGDDVEVADTVIPGPHMTPRDDAARKAVKAAGARMTRTDPIEAMTTPTVAGAAKT